MIRDGEWFEDLVDGTDVSVRVGVKADGEWIDRSQLVTNENDETSAGYVIDVDRSGEDRYRMVTGDNGVVVESWQRFEFPIEETVEGEDVSGDDLAFIVDVTTSDRSLPDSVPWHGLEEVLVSLDVFDRDSNFLSVDADRVAGLQDEKERLVEFLTASDEDWGLSEPTGVILEGSPGTGKTELVMEVCQERYGEIPVMISGPEILNKWVGESERLLREKFEEAWATEHKVLYIDELDAIAQSRSEASESYSAQIVAQLLVLLDGVSSKEQAADADRSLKVVASTNLSHVVDEALRRPGRLGNRPIRFSYPSREERRAILHHYLENIYRSADGELDPELEAFVQDSETPVLDRIVEDTDGFTGADLEDLIQASVRKLRDTDQQQLDRDTIRALLDEGGFSQREAFTEKILPGEEIRQGTTGGVGEYDGAQPGLREVDEGDVEQVACEYFAEVLSDADEQEWSLTLRTVEPRDVMASDVVRATEEMVQAFQHRDNERLALYLKDADMLVQAREGSELADRLLGVIHEQFLQWESENVLLVPGGVDDDVISFTLR